MSEYDIIVIGGGMAGMSTALTAARLGRTVAIITGGIPGGELLNIERIDGIPGHEDGIAGYDLCPITQELADAAGVEFLTEAATQIAEGNAGWNVTCDSGTFGAGALVLATGAKIAKLGVPGEDEFTGRGVSHCASCDGPLLRGKIAVVAGGGDSAMQEALTLANHVEKVVMVTTGEALSGQVQYCEEAEANSKIELVTRSKVAAVEGDTSVERVRITNLATGEQSEIAAQGVFSFVGLEPNTALADGLVELASDGRIVVNCELAASAPGIFAAGNCRTGNSWRAAGAIGDGANAAIAADLYLTAKQGNE